MAAEAAVVYSENNPRRPRSRLIKENCPVKCEFRVGKNYETKFGPPLRSGLGFVCVIFFSAPLSFPEVFIFQMECGFSGVNLSRTFVLFPRGANGPLRFSGEGVAYCRWGSRLCVLGSRSLLF